MSRPQGRVRRRTIVMIAALAGAVALAAGLARASDGIEVSFDDLRYRYSDVAELRVVDAAQAGAASITAHVSSESDPTGMDVTLVETAPSSGEFTAHIFFNLVQTAPGTLVAHPGKVVTLAYQGHSDTSTIFSDDNGSVDFVTDTGLYRIGDVATIRVTDVDRDSDETSPQSFSVPVTSSEDMAGVSVTVTETGDGTGVFEGTLGFENDGGGSQAGLEVNPDNDVLVVYQEPNSLGVGDPVMNSDQVKIYPDDAAAALDAVLYELTQVAAVTVVDHDANASAVSVDTVSATLASGEDAAGITLALTEDGQDTGRFVGTAAFKDDDAGSVEGTLEVESGDTVTLTYQPALPGGAPDRTDTARMRTDATAGFDRARYEVAGAPQISVTDPDANADPANPETVSVVVSSSTDAAGEPVTLTETGPDTGVFVGSAALSAGEAAGAVQVAEGDALTTAYTERAFDGTGDATRTAGAGMYSSGAAILDRGRYALADAPVLTVADGDLDASPDADTVGVTLKSATDPAGIPVTLTESGPSTGVFTGSASFTSGPSGAGALGVAPGDTVTLVYPEATTFEGTPADRERTATMFTDAGDAALDHATYTADQTAALAVSDADADLDGAAVEAVVATLSSSSDPTGIPVTLTETGPATGEFTGTASFTSGPSGGSALHVAPPDQVTLTYHEPTFAGDTASRDATAVITSSTGGGGGPGGGTGGGGGGGGGGGTLDPVGRLAGEDRIATAIAISKASFPSGGAGAVVLSRSDDFADALPGTPLAAAEEAPLLLTPTARLDARTKAEIQRVLAAGKTVYLLGGTGALSGAVQSEVSSLGYTVVRYSGADRYQTAVSIANALGEPATLLLATGTNFPDALAGGAAAAKAHGAVLLTNGSTMPAATAGYIAGHPTAVRYALGGPAAAADPAAAPIVGADRYETARKVAERFFEAPPVAGVASGANFPDALAGGAHVAMKGAPLMLASSGALPATVRDYLAANASSIASGYVYGGTAVVGDAVLTAAQQAIS